MATFFFLTPAVSRGTLEGLNVLRLRRAQEGIDCFQDERTNLAKWHEEGGVGQATKWANAQHSECHAWQCGKCGFLKWLTGIMHVLLSICFERSTKIAYFAVFPIGKKWKPNLHEGWWDLNRVYKNVKKSVDSICICWIVPSGPTLGFVYRNCTAHGWSELYPPYQEACAFRNDSEPESEVQTSDSFSSFLSSHVFFPLSFLSPSTELINSRTVEGKKRKKERNPKQNNRNTE